MALTQEIYTERVLIVLNPDGSFRGAHQEKFRRVMDGETVLQAIQSPAEPVTAETLASVLPGQASLLAQLAAEAEAAAVSASTIEGLRADLVSAETAKTQALAAAATAEASRAQGALAAEAAVAAAQEAAAAAISTSDAAHAAEVATLTARIAQLEALLAPVDAAGFAVLSPVQIRLGLLAGGLTSAMVQGAIDAIADPVARESANAYWHYSTSYHRSHPLIATLGVSLGLTSQQIDTMWTVAAGLG